MAGICCAARGVFGDLVGLICAAGKNGGGCHSLSMSSASRRLDLVGAALFHTFRHSGLFGNGPRCVHFYQENGRH